MMLHTQTPWNPSSQCISRSLNRIHTHERPIKTVWKLKREEIREGRKKRTTTKLFVPTRSRDLAGGSGINMCKYRVVAAAHAAYLIPVTRVLRLRVRVGYRTSTSVSFLSSSSGSSPSSACIGKEPLLPAIIGLVLILILVPANSSSVEKVQGWSYPIYCVLEHDVHTLDNAV